MTAHAQDRSVTLRTVDTVLTPAQARALAVIATYHPDEPLTIYPPIGGTVGVGVGERLYQVDADGTETS